MSETHSVPSSYWIALRVSGLKLENSSSVSNPSERIRASILSAFERFGSLKIAWHGADPVVIEAERE